jgi:para-aminobenzoate synthetase component I
MWPVWCVPLCGRWRIVPEPHDGSLGGPVLVQRFPLPTRPADVMETLAARLLEEVRKVRTESGRDPGFLWLDSGGPALDAGSECVVTAFCKKRVVFTDPGEAGLVEQMAGFEEGVPVDPLAQALGFRGGWLGFLGYEAVEAFEPVRLHAKRDLEVPVASWGLFPVWFRWPVGAPWLELWAREGVEGSEGVPSLSSWIEWAQQVIALPGAQHGPSSGLTLGDRDKVATGAVRSFSRETFEDAVRAVQEAVREGEVFQANLAHRLSLDCEVDPFRVYQVLRRLNPSPFMGFVEESWGALVCNSPERLFSVRHQDDERVVEARPIAGTRPRGRDEEEDARLRAELRASAKERSEHTMLVDLLRNDVGRVSRRGSVRVDAFQEVETYSHVLHLVSRVKGVLREDVGVDDLVRALFPGGTITGAPKLRSIEVIDRFEPVARGPYTGSLGYVNPDGSMDLNIMIRTLVMSQARAHAYAGAGIVAQSDAGAEYEETLHKAAAMLLALDAAKRSLSSGDVEVAVAPGGLRGA